MSTQKHVTHTVMKHQNTSNYMYTKWSLGIMKLNNIYLLPGSIFVNIIINKTIDNIKLTIMNTQHVT